MKAIKILLITTLFLSCNNGYGQNLYFSKSNYADTVAFKKNIQFLADELLKNYSNGNPNDSLDNLFRIQIVATQFDNALVNIKKYRDLWRIGKLSNANGVGFIYELYAQSIILSNNKNNAFPTVCKDQFKLLYSKLSYEAATTAASYFDNDVDILRKNFTDHIKKMEVSDSLNVLDAKKLCRLFLLYEAYKNVLPISKPILQKLETEKFIVQDSVIIKTKDGSTISALVVRKRNVNKKLPSVFLFNIYKGVVDIKEAKNAAHKGFVGVIASTRGKGISPQEIEPYEHDASDGYDIIDWISKQPWSNGKVGMYGGSYLGFSQWATVKKVHPALKTIVPQVAVGFGIDFPTTNRVFSCYSLRWIRYVTNNKTTDYSNFSDNNYWKTVTNKWYKSGSSFRSLDSIEGKPSSIFQRWLKHPSYDSFWQKTVAYKNDFAQINIPILTITGYFDDDQLGAMHYFNQHHQYNKNANHYLLIGPYDHYGAQAVPSTEVDGYKIDSVAKINITDLVFNWFDYTLKNAPKPTILKDKINYEVMGANMWKHTRALKKMSNDTLTFYIGTEKDSLDYKMTTIKNEQRKYVEQEVDFKYRDDTLVNPNQKLNSLNEKNMFTYITPVFKDSFELNGVIVGQIAASINKKDFDINLEIKEIKSNGKTFFISSNYFRASYTKDETTRLLLKPDSIETIPINNNYMTSLKISVGSRLIFGIGVVKSSNAQINYGTGKDVSDETIKDAEEPLKIKWYNDTYFKVPIFRIK